MLSSKKNNGFSNNKQEVVSITYEEIGLFPRSFSRVLDRFLKQVFSDVEHLVIQEYRFYRYLFLTTVRSLLILFFVPFLINFLAKTYVIRPLTEYFWNTKQTEIFLNSYQEAKAFSELKDFEEKLYFESLIYPKERSASSLAPQAPIEHSSTVKGGYISFQQTQHVVPALHRNIKQETPFVLGFADVKSVVGTQESLAENPAAVHSNTKEWLLRISSQKEKMPNSTDKKTLQLQDSLNDKEKSDIWEPSQELFLAPQAHQSRSSLVRDKEPSSLFSTESLHVLSGKKATERGFFSAFGAAESEPRDSVRSGYALGNPESPPTRTKLLGTPSVLSEKRERPRPEVWAGISRAGFSPLEESSPKACLGISLGYPEAAQRDDSACGAKRDSNTQISPVSLFHSKNLKSSLFVYHTREAKKNLHQRYQEKILALAQRYNNQSIEAITNFFGDVVSLLTLFYLLYVLEIQINITKSFLLEVFFGLDDSKKSLLILLITDLLVGYHSSNLWELFFEFIFNHYGFPESQTGIFLLVATLPVLLDVLFKYLIFRHLNRSSPATVATYHAMIE